MASSAASRKIRRRALDHLRQKLWAVPAHLRLRVSRRGSAGKQRAYRATSIR